MSDLFKKLSKKQMEFICEECEIDEKKLENLSDDEAYDIYDAICDIEVETTIEAGDGELSERGKMAENIVTIIGNTIREIEGIETEYE